MAATATVSQQLSYNDSTQATQIVRGKIVLTGNYGGVSTHGDTLALNLYNVQSNQPPLRVLITEEPAAGTYVSGYFFDYGLGTSPANGVIIVSLIDTGTGLKKEYTEGSGYSSALLAAALYFEAVFPLGN